MYHVPDTDVLDKAISLLQWTAQELTSASGTEAKPGAFSLPSSFGSFHSDSLDAALRELQSMQRSTSTERLHRLLADGETEAGHDSSPTHRTRSGSSRESALSLLSILSTSSSMAEALSIFLDTQFPGARELIDTDGLLEQADIARLPSLHPRASELEFLRDLRALEVQPGPQPDTHFSKEPAGQAQPSQQAPAGETQLTADVLRMLSAEHLQEASEDNADGDWNSSPSRMEAAQLKGRVRGAPASPGTPSKKRKARQSSGLAPKPAQPAQVPADDADLDMHHTDNGAIQDVNADVDRYQGTAEQQAPSVALPASQEITLRPPPWKAKRRRTRRSEDSDPSWQPPDRQATTSAVECTAVELGNSTAAALPDTRRRGPKYAALVGIRMPKSKYKGVSCHKSTLRWESSLWLDGRQVYLGGFATEDDAAKAYDLAVVGCRGPSAELNFPAADYAEILSTDLAGLSQDEVIAYMRRRSNAFSRGKSRYRGVSGREGRWETRIGTFAGLKNVSFGVHDEEERAGRMYDRAIIVERGRGAKTNFPLQDYEQEIADFEAFVEAKFGDLPEAAREEERARVYLPLDEFVALHLSPASGVKIKKPRPRKVNGIRAVNLQAVLQGPG